RLGLATQIRAPADVLAEQAAGGDVGHGSVFGDALRLGALSRARQSQENQVQAADRLLPDEPFVLPHEELGLDLAHSVKDDADDDDEAGGGDAKGGGTAGQGEVAADYRGEDAGRDRDEPQE